jgi:hypothetical protein
MLRDFATELGLLGLVIHNVAVIRDSGDIDVGYHAEVWSMEIDPARQCSRAEIVGNAGCLNA